MKEISGQANLSKQVEQKLIEEALARSGGNQAIAAQILGITRQALNNRLQRKGDLVTVQKCAIN